MNLLTTLMMMFLTGDGSTIEGKMASQWVAEAEVWLEDFEDAVRGMTMTSAPLTSSSDVYAARQEFNEVLALHVDAGRRFGELDEAHPELFATLKTSVRANRLAEAVRAVDQLLYVDSTHLVGGFTPLSSNDGVTAAAHKSPTYCVGFVVGHRRCCSRDVGCGVCYAGLGGGWSCGDNVRDCGHC